MSCTCGILFLAALGVSIVYKGLLVNFIKSQDNTCNRRQALSLRPTFILELCYLRSAFKSNCALTHPLQLHATQQLAATNCK